MGSWLSVGATQQEGMFKHVTYQLPSNHRAELLLAVHLQFIRQALRACEQQKLGMKHAVVHIMPLMWRTGSGMPERVYAFGASLLLALPVVRHIMSWMGVVPADKQVMLDVLSKASGGALPEGIAGIFTGASRCISSFPYVQLLSPPPPLSPYLVSPRWCCLPRGSP